uniref:Uncharacterized protein n=1 Tax=Physcomitrium patens TaxID=3218 RepID=A0A7I4BG68_PHYPA
MRFTQSVITKTLRLGNPVALLWREAMENVKLNEKVIPKCWKMVCAIQEAQLNSALFDRPYEFNPWRAPRYCPGAELAPAKICIFLHYLVTKFNLKSCGEDTVSFFPVPKFSNGLQVQMHEHDSSTKI